jgi:hypothetical protein
MLRGKESGVIPLWVLLERFNTLIVLIDELIERIKRIDPTSPITAMQIDDTVALAKRIAREQVEFGLPFFVDVLGSKRKDFVGFATGNPLVKHGVAHSTGVVISGHLGDMNRVSIPIIVDDLRASGVWLRNEIPRLQGPSLANGKEWTESIDKELARQQLTAIREVYDELRNWFRLSITKGNVEHSVTLRLIRKMLTTQKKHGMPFVTAFNGTKDNDIRFFFSSPSSSQQVAIVPHKLPTVDLQSLPSIIDAFDSLIRFIDTKLHPKEHSSDTPKKLASAIAGTWAWDGELKTRFDDAIAEYAKRGWKADSKFKGKACRARKAGTVIDVGKDTERGFYRAGDGFVVFRFAITKQGKRIETLQGLHKTKLKKFLESVEAIRNNG